MPWGSSGTSGWCSITFSLYTRPVRSVTVGSPSSLRQLETPMSPDQLTFDNPVERHSHIVPHAQWQPFPGLDAQLSPKADHGETTYRGTGRLVGRKALITGADSGVGAAVAIAFAREG